jgi:hypothetical protein
MATDMLVDLAIDSDPEEQPRVSHVNLAWDLFRVFLLFLNTTMTKFIGLLCFLGDGSVLTVFRFLTLLSKVLGGRHLRTALFLSLLTSGTLQFLSRESQMQTPPSPPQSLHTQVQLRTLKGHRPEPPMFPLETQMAIIACAGNSRELRPALVLMLCARHAQSQPQLHP